MGFLPASGVRVDRHSGSVFFVQIDGDLVKKLGGIESEKVTALLHSEIDKAGVCSGPYELDQPYGAAGRAHYRGRCLPDRK